MIRAYLGIMQARLGRRLAWSVRVPKELEAIAIPPGMFITLTENAIKHGIEPSPSGGRVDVSVARDGEALALCVTDTGVGLAAAAGASGIGLANIRERLALLYGDAAALDLASIEPRGFSARILLPVERPPVPFPDRHSVTEPGSSA